MHGLFFEPPLEDNAIIHQLSEILHDKIYDEVTKNKENLTIIDAGANIGITSYFFSRIAKTVYAIEPGTQHLACLRKMIEFNQLNNIVVIPKALYMRKETLNFYYYPNKTCSSLIRLNEEIIRGTETVETITLSELFDQYKIDTVDFMKMDIEGTEVEVFQTQDFKELAPRIKTIVFETHGWAPRNNNQTFDALKNCGYKVDKYPTVADLYIAKHI